MEDGSLCSESPAERRGEFTEHKTGISESVPTQQVTSGLWRAAGFNYKDESANIYITRFFKQDLR